MVKSSEVAFEFPVYAVPVGRTPEACRNMDELTRLVPSQAKAGRYENMRLVDASGRRWVVRSFRKLGPVEPMSWVVVFCFLFGSPRDWRVEYELEELEPAKPRRRRKPQAKVAGGKGTVGSGGGSDKGSVGSESQLEPSRPGKMVSASEVDFQYPLIGFSEREGVLAFEDYFYLTTCAAFYVRQQTHIGMELIDNGLRRWIVRAVTPNEPLVEKRWWQIFRSDSVQFDLRLEAAPPVDFGELKQRLLKAWELEDLDSRRAVRKATDLAEMMEASSSQATGLC